MDISELQKYTPNNCKGKNRAKMIAKFNNNNNKHRTTNNKEKVLDNNNSKIKITNSYNLNNMNSTKKTNR